ncbi:hypothetical protein GGS20DRAFT_134479 [Poronia punctata]|nr:hypothetical protein GGS20DRAFT_134479 [Poronia punctata]
MSSESQPISPARFAEAIRELPSSSLALKLAELRTAIAQLDYSNEELAPYAEGRKQALGNDTTTEESQPDQDCVDAINENRAVIERMRRRIELIRAEIEDTRGMSWHAFMDAASGDWAEEVKQVAARMAQEGDETSNGTSTNTNTNTNTANGHSEDQHEAWRDGTFQTGTLRVGTVSQNQTTGMSDEELLRELLSRIPGSGDNQDPDGGMHL